MNLMFMLQYYALAISVAMELFLIRLLSISIQCNLITPYLILKPLVISIQLPLEVANS